MINTSGLSLDQAPPFEAPLKFFVSAPLFGLLATIVGILGFEGLTTLHSPPMLAFVHLMALGVAMMTMIGAVMQMMPVLSGARFPNVKATSDIIYDLLAIGALLLTLGFWHGWSWALTAGGALAAGSVTLFALLGLRALFGSPSPHPTTQTMRTALWGVLAGVTLALALLYTRLSEAGEYQMVLLTLHPTWMLFGWTLMLIMGVAWQVIPMFYVTPEYPAWCQRWMRPILIGSLLLFSLLLLLGYTVAAALALLLTALGYIGFAAVTMGRLRRAKRTLPEATKQFWRISSLSLVGGLVLLGAGWAGDSRWLYSGGALIGYGTVIGIISGMLYKIVSFLTWFHLSAKGYFDLPTMRELGHEMLARRHAWLHLGATLLWAAAPWAEWCASGALTLMGVGFGIQFYILSKAAVFYRATVRTEPAFPMPTH